jgi:hypothetical protein
MSALNSHSAILSGKRYGDGGKDTLIAVDPEPVIDGEDGVVEAQELCVETARMERMLVRKIDWRLCTIAGVLCSLNLLDRLVF